MPDNGVARFISPGQTVDTSRPRERDDPNFLNSDTLNGVLEHYDLAAGGASWAGGNFADLAVIRNIVNDRFKQPRPGDAAAIVPAGQVLPFTGNGALFAGVTALGVYLRGSAAATAALQATANKFFTHFLVVTLPTEANWNAEAIALPFYTHANAVTGNAEVPDLITVAMLTTGGSKAIRVFRQTALGAADIFTITLPAASPAFGKPVVIHSYRIALGLLNQNADMYHCTAGAGTAAPTIVKTAGVRLGSNTGNANTQNFGASPGLVGITNNRWGGRIGDGRRSWSVHRWSLEALEISGRDAAALTMPYATRVFARNVFS